MVHKLIYEDLCDSIEEITIVECSIATNSVFTILYQQLQIRKISYRFMPHLLITALEMSKHVQVVVIT